ncbi:MAG: hypothetical protein K6G83_10250 [Lachnospiraceae bacterium]|nr:hypothetical protein [Lachnospiraceae bacterium]
MQKIKDFILSIIHLNNEYTSTAMYFGLYLFMLVLMAFFARDRKYDAKRVVIPACVLLWVIYLLLPFLLVFLEFGLDEQIRARTFWTLMIPPVIAVGFTALVFEVEQGRKRFMAIIAVCLLLMASGEFKINNNVFQKAENLYKLPQELVDVCDTVLGDGREVKLIVPYETAHVFRQYSTDILLLYGEDATIQRVVQTTYEINDTCREMMSEAPDLNFVGEVARKNQVDYILFDTVYQTFGGHSLNFDGYAESPDFAGDRSATDEQKAVTADVRLYNRKGEVFWGLREFGLDYVGRFGQYMLYRYE